MGFLDRLFGRKGGADAPAHERPPDEVVAAADCPHATMTPRWDEPGDFGKQDAISTYICEACGRSFSREEGERLMAGAADRARIDESLRKTVEEEKENA